LFLFAVDINLLINKRDENVLQYKVNEAMKLEFWFQKNNFPMRPKITYRNTDIAYKPVTKFLGVHTKENLKWTTHIHILRLQLSRVCYIIKSVQGIMGLGMIRNFTIQNLNR